MGLDHRRIVDPRIVGQQWSSLLYRRDCWWSDSVENRTMEDGGILMTESTFVRSILVETLGQLRTHLETMDRIGCEDVGARNLMSRCVRDIAGQLREYDEHCNPRTLVGVA